MSEYNMLGRNNSTRDHAWIEERLSEYLDNRLAANARARVETHLRECADCRASLESLRWTTALVKHAPAPALPRAFTLPVPAPRAQRSALAFGFAQFGAALATLLLIAVIGVDVIAQFGGGMSAPMASTAKEFSAPTLEIAAAPQAEARDQIDIPAPTAAAIARPTMPPAPKPAEPTKAPMPTAAPPAAAPPAPMSLMPTVTISRPVGAS
ncbi:MAG: zf-HC2 domain-containing protein, partial [Anaerolineales bacterium]|nr:zf-HC2 domain-containing protein [Anaerolineales bacterium]